MKKLLVVILPILVLTSSCDNRFDFLNDLNADPSILFLVDSDEKESLNDSLKTSIKYGDDFYEIKLLVSDPENLLGTLSHQFILGDGTLMQSGEEVTGNINFSDGVAEVEYYPGAESNISIRFTISDNLGNKKSAVLDLLVFDNLLPIPDFTLEKISLNDPLEYDLDGSDSYDQDQAQGGGLQKWEWNINGQKFLSPNAITRFVFPSTGNYEIKLKVIDNDGAMSTAEKRQVITINN